MKVLNIKYRTTYVKHTKFPQAKFNTSFGHEDSIGNWDCDSSLEIEQDSIEIKNENIKSKHPELFKWSRFIKIKNHKRTICEYLTI